MCLVYISDAAGTAVAGAIVAAVGYVGKLLVDLALEFDKSKRDRRSQLVELRSLLRVTKASFFIQRQHAIHLGDMLRQRDPSRAAAGGYERIFASNYHSLTPEEKELHGIIRGITMYALSPTNAKIIEWIQRDTYFRGQQKSERQIGKLPDYLSDLHTHLLLWVAKYETWIPDKPEHALIYLDDEEKHGIGFPKGIDDQIERVLPEM